MFETNDDAYLTKQISANNCILFLGAGFCWDMTNRLGMRFPLGRDVAGMIWKFLGYSGDIPSNMTLTRVFELFLASKHSESDRRRFLEDRLLSEDIPDTYDVVARVLWNRIYSVNVDDSLGRIYRRAGISRLKVVHHPSTYLPERDQFLEEVQAIYLHGILPGKPSDLTFSMKQYASRQAGFDRLYDNFVGDYGVSTVIFVGTELDEPVFYQYLAAREGRGETERERRPRSFLVSPSVNDGVRDLLKQFNIVAYANSTGDFLNWLSTRLPNFATKDDLLRARLPTLGRLKSATSEHEISKRILERFSSAFHEVPISPAGQSGDKSKYLLGASPRWEDIHRDLDAARDITPGLIHFIEQALDGPAVVVVQAIVGSAGCGKSTILRRIGLSLAQRGRRCYLSNSEELPDASDVAKVLDALTDRVVLLFDNSEGALSYISRLGSALKGLKKPPVIVLAARQNDFNRKFGRINYDQALEVVEVPNLSLNEIYRVLTVLEEQNLLGKLREMTPAERVNEFSVRSGKQILVAMREATSGQDFDQILLDEFRSLPSEEAKVLYACVGICTDAGYRVEKSEFIRFARVESAICLDILDVALQGMVLRTGPTQGLLMLRHRRIAEFLVDTGAPRDLVLEAYLRVLPVLAPAGKGESRVSRRFKLYRELINHESLLKRFSGVSAPRQIYDHLAPLVSDDSQYYLQYGCLEMQAGDLDFAKNYLAQAEALDPRNRFVANAQGHLLLKRSVVARNLEEAIALRAEGKQRLNENLNFAGSYDAHFYSIVCEEALNWIHRWIPDLQDRGAELSQLREFIRDGRKQYPRSRELKGLEARIEDEYLRSAIR